MDTNYVGKKVKELRENSKMTQKELANLLNYSESFISHIENGNRNISQEDLKKIADIFNVSFDIFSIQPNFRQPFNNFRANHTNESSDNIDKILDDFKKFAQKS